jgi:sigma-E factor negative regulatory protein RseC
METVTGIVQNVHDQLAIVRVDAPVACARCASGKGCGAGLLTQDERPRELEVVVPEGLSLRRGDPVNLAIAPQYLLRAAFFAYGLPLVGILGAAAIGWVLGLATTDVAAVGCVLAGLALGVLAGRRMSAATAACQQFTPRVDRLPVAAAE